MENGSFNYDAWDDPNFDEDDYGSHWSGDEIEDGCEWDDDFLDEDVCCYDPRYTGVPGTCHCKEYQEANDRAEKWYNKIRYTIHYTWQDIRIWIRDRVFNKGYKVECDRCSTKFSFRKHGRTCPECGSENLPF